MKKLKISLKENRHVRQRMVKRIWPPFIAQRSKTSLGVIQRIVEYGLEALMKHRKGLGPGVMAAYGIIRNGEVGNPTMLGDQKIACC